MIDVPGSQITEAVKRYWRNGLFSKVSITADSIVGSKIYLCIHLGMRPRISSIHYNGIKKAEREDMETKLGMMRGGQLTPNMIDRAKILAKKYFDEKGYKNAEIDIIQRDDPEKQNQVILDVNIDKKAKMKVHKLSTRPASSRTSSSRRSSPTSATMRPSRHCSTNTMSSVSAMLPLWKTPSRTTTTSTSMSM